mmetsp:Transcript_15142/g.28501  ORF Transcript_15142/g.28501 Transcript_15142/m.28501 type:complete len:88 (-) Transcript_15142:3354-3617(-)
MALSCSRQHIPDEPKDKYDKNNHSCQHFSAAAPIHNSVMTWNITVKSSPNIEIFMTLDAWQYNHTLQYYIFIANLKSLPHHFISGKL